MALNANSMILLNLILLIENNIYMYQLNSTKFDKTCGMVGLWCSGLACLIFTAAIGVRIPVVAVKFHNVYDNTRGKLGSQIGT